MSIPSDIDNWEPIYVLGTLPGGLTVIDQRDDEETDADRWVLTCRPGYRPGVEHGEWLVFRLLPDMRYVEQRYHVHLADAVQDLANRDEDPDFS